MNNKFLEPIRMQSVSSGSVVDRIINQIRQAVTSGRFQLGDKLPTEFELMEELNVSRNSLREAIRVLTTLGIVEIKRGDGTYFCREIKPSAMDFVTYSLLLEKSNASEIIQLRQTLDEDVLSMAMKQCTDADIEKLEWYIQQMRSCFVAGDVSGAAKMDYQFHLYLTSCCRNKFLERIVAGVYTLFESSIERNILTEELFAMADQHHQEIVDCLKSKDDTKVPLVIAHSLSSWRANVEKDGISS